MSASKSSFRNSTPVSQSTTTTSSASPRTCMMLHGLDYTLLTRAFGDELGMSLIPPYEYAGCKRIEDILLIDHCLRRCIICFGSANIESWGPPLYPYRRQGREWIYRFACQRPNRSGVKVYKKCKKRPRRSRYTRPECYVSFGNNYRTRIHGPILR
jgi:hypothetical protein